MDIVRGIFLLIHLVGFAVLFGAWVVELFNRNRGITRLMHWGLAITAIGGLALAAPMGADLDYAKLATKFAILIVIGALLGIGAGRQRKSGGVPPAIFWPIGILTLVNAAIAVLWR